MVAFSLSNATVAAICLADTPTLDDMKSKYTTLRKFSAQRYYFFFEYASVLLKFMYAHKKTRDYRSIISCFEWYV